MHTPSWIKDDSVLIVNANTCGINKDGNEQYIVNPTTGVRSISEIDDELAECCDSIRNGDFSSNQIFYHDYMNMITKDVCVPKYYDQSTINCFNQLIDKYDDLSSKSLGELQDEESILIFNGHGSPSSDQRLGTIPYIKVSDLRAGQVNINPTNLVPIELAKKFWKSDDSGLKAYDLISPERASKNIGEFCVLMPGQEKAVFTKEVIVIRANNEELFDQFYLMWALSLKEVRTQWDRIVFMQTNREDVGKRLLEIKIPIPDSVEIALNYSKDFKDYYSGIEEIRRNFILSLKNSQFNHHIHLGD